jgi:surface protein
MAEKLQSINQWGDIERESFEHAFYGATNLQILATDTPNLTKVTSMYGMFYNATNLTGNFSGWDTSNVQSMSYLFYNATNFNRPLTNWKFTKLIDAKYMFSYANAFNQNLSSWDMSGVTDFSYMFYFSLAFNGEVSHRDTNKVQNMSFMFYNAANFNQDLSSRNVEGISSTSNMQYMLYNTALSTYNYNAILDTRSQQNILSGMIDFEIGSTYGGEGCISNALAGINGHDFLMQSKGRRISDIGLEWRCNPGRPFITTRKTTSSNDTITIPTTSTRTPYNFDIDRGDGTTGSYMGEEPTVNHTYGRKGIYQIKISGIFPRIYFDGNFTMAQKLQSIDQRGDIVWESMALAFYRATHLQVLATDAPNLSNVISTAYMFYEATNLSGNFSQWDTSTLQDMSYMFYNATHFDQDLSQRNIEGINAPSGLQYIFLDTALSTYNYNAILDSRSKQDVLNDIYDFNIRSTYGGACAGISNAAAGIAGRTFLEQTKGRMISDAGLKQCNTYSGRPFITTREIFDDTALVSFIPSTKEYYNVLIDWGDGTLVEYP